MSGKLACGSKTAKNEWQNMASKKRIYKLRKEGKLRPPNKPVWEMYSEAEIERRLERAREYNATRPKGRPPRRFIKLRGLKEANGVANKRIPV
jgi:hypothetical protein